MLWMSHAGTACRVHCSVAGIQVLRQVTGGLTDTLSPSAQTLTRALLEADLSKRLPVQGTAKHEFFEGLDVFTLYRRPRGPELPEIQPRGPKDPGGDERWNRRKFSMIWTVMPSAQDPHKQDAASTDMLIAQSSDRATASFSTRLLASKFSFSLKLARDKLEGKATPFWQRRKCTRFLSGLGGAASQIPAAKASKPDAEAQFVS
ncbi:unnamed protein product [Symbiodinium necroappetens]|uniref:Uncharacterized protein n=1 Tax=Symbiodinium necroappetens TaxID=1628268 RepID=A0A812K980_9DINO|nr:unnamed protein product [Symbiodinium necroappetens]